MTVALSWFHNKMGPMVFMTFPEVEITTSSEKGQRFMDVIETEGFIFTDTSEQGKVSRNLNYMFSIFSPIARGRVETLMLSYIVTEADPNIESYKEKILECAKRIKDKDYIYMAFNEEGKNESEMRRFIEAKDFLFKSLEALDRDLRKREIESVGYIESYSDIKNTAKIHIPISIDGAKNDVNYLLIFKEESDGTFRVVGHPTTKSVYKITILNDALSQEEHASIIETFQKFGDKIIATSGICQGIDNICVFEAYIEHDGDLTKINDLRRKLAEKISSERKEYPDVRSQKIERGEVVATRTL